MINLKIWKFEDLEIWRLGEMLMMKNILLVKNEQ